MTTTTADPTTTRSRLRFSKTDPEQITGSLNDELLNKLYALAADDNLDAQAEYLLNNLPPVRLTSGRRTVTLLPMFHIAPPRFLATRMDQIRSAHANGAVVFQEGVHSSRKLARNAAKKLRNPDSYKNRRSVYATVAERTGWQAQTMPPVPFEVHDMDLDTLPVWKRALMKLFAGFVTTAYKAVLPLLLRIPDSARLIRTMMLALVDTTQPNPFNKKTRLPLARFVVGDRNRILTDAILATEQDVIAVWGDGHTPGVVELLQQAGFRTVQTPTA